MQPARPRLLGGRITPARRTSMILNQTDIRFLHIYIYI